MCNSVQRSEEISPEPVGALNYVSSMVANGLQPSKSSSSRQDFFYMRDIDWFLLLLHFTFWGKCGPLKGWNNSLWQRYLPLFDFPWCEECVAAPAFAQRTTRLRESEDDKIILSESIYKLLFHWNNTWNNFHSWDLYAFFYHPTCCLSYMSSGPQSPPASYCIMLYHIVLYLVALCCIVSYRIVFHGIVPHCIMLCCVISYRIKSHHVVSYCIMCIISFRIISYCTMLYCMMSYCIVSYRIVL